MPSRTGYLTIPILDDRGSLAFDGMAEGVVDCKEVPGFRLRRVHKTVHDRRCDGVRVPVPLETRRRALLCRKFLSSSTDDDVYALAFPSQILDCKRYARIAEARYHADVFDIEPTTDDAEPDVRFVLIVTRNDLDLSTEHLAAKILDRHLGRYDVSGPSDAGQRSRHVLQDANPHG